MERRRAIVAGRVQGVGFRVSAQREGERLGLVGSVRNRSDGTVEAEYEGPAEAIAAFERWLRSGPAAASVDSVQVEPRDRAGGSGFEVR